MSDKDTMQDKNPHLEKIANDIKSRSKWAEIDADILKRRMAERPKKRVKPYPNAPNFVVPIVDDGVREKTTQELAMIHGAPYYAHIIPLSSGMSSALRSQAELGFDTYLRHLIKAAGKIEEANDCKNARGYSILAVTRTQHARWGLLPDFETVDPRDFIVPAATRELSKSPRMVRVLRLTPDQLRAKAEELDWQNVEAVIKQAQKEDRDSGGGVDDDGDAFSKIQHLIGLTTSGVGSETVVVWEYWHHADEWDIRHNPSADLKEGKRCCTVFSPDAPDLMLNAFPWREEDTVVAKSDEAMIVELNNALIEKREPERFDVVTGKEREWPFIQPRYEGRSGFFYDVRGVGHLCMDDQIAATATQNAKMTMSDYFQLPLFNGTPRKSVTFEPGSFLGDDVKPLQMPPIPAQFDFDIDAYKRNAGRRIGASGQYAFSEQIASTRKVEKTATEVQHESTRSSVVSSTDVDRFNHPFAELYQQLWEDLKRIGRPLPIIQNENYSGDLSVDIFKFDVLVVPASSAKTLNPDLQFNRAINAWKFTESMMQHGVGVNPQEVAQDILSAWDGQKAQRWLFDPRQAQGQLPPIYMMVQQIGEKMAQLVQAVEATGKLAMENSEKIEQVTGGTRR